MSQHSVTNFPDAPDIESSTMDYLSRFDGKVGAWMLKRQTSATRKALLKTFDDRRNLTILDVGGGHGQNIDLINELGHQITVVGSHISCTEPIKHQMESGKVRFNVSHLLALPYEDNSFDVVICYRILSHMESWHALIGELSRVARSLVLIDYPAKLSVNIMSELFFAIKKRVEHNTRHFVTFSASEINLAFAQYNLRRTFLAKEFFLPMALHRMLGSVFFSVPVAQMFRLAGLTRLFGSPCIAGYSPQP